MTYPVAVESGRECFGRSILPYLAPSLRPPCSPALSGHLPAIEELRIRCGLPLMAVSGEGDFYLAPDGSVSRAAGRAYLPGREDLERTMQLLAQGSVYAIEEELRQGYLTLPGGHRVGLAGRALLDGGRIMRLTDISSLNFRVARAVPGMADRLIPGLVKAPGQIAHTLLVSPPRAGKTTLLRDVVRQLSTGIARIHLAGFKVGLVDERSEVAASYHGIPQNDVGPRTDVLDACPKAEGIRMLIRSMSPQVVATDELGGERDLTAVEELINAGVTLITTAHGSCLEEIQTRPGLMRLLEWKVFGRIAFLGRSLGVGTLERLVDEDSRDLLTHPVLLRPVETTDLRRG